MVPSPTRPFREFAPPEQAVNVQKVATPTKPVAIKPADKRWVTSDRLNRRTCPSTACGVVGQYFFREAADVFETENGWARVSHDYDASCVSGTSEYVDAGNALCDPSNGITDGRFAEWVSIKYLSKSRPDDPSKGAVGYVALIAGSDDFKKYHAEFDLLSSLALSVCGRK